MQPFVSILIPAYNAERWIGETVRSALNQRWPRKEIIIVDDGSSDKTYMIAKSFESKHLKVFRQNNAGGPAARNKALSFAQGDFIQWLDHDDLLDRDKIYHQLKSGEYDGNTSTLLSSGCGTFFCRVEKAKFTPNGLWRDLTPIEFFLVKFGTNSWLQSAVWLVSRRLTEEAGPWWELRSPDDDGEYFARVIKACEKIRFVPEAKSYWRVGNYRSMSGSRSISAMSALLESLRASMNHLRSMEESERTRKACLKYLQTRSIDFYPGSSEILRRGQDLASELGGTLKRPKLKWKYWPIEKIFGWGIARKISIIMPRLKTSIFQKWDEIYFNMRKKWNIF